MYDRGNPYHSKVVERYPLSKEGSTKETWHVALDLEGSGISFRPGDSIAIFSQNQPELVATVLQSIACSGDEVVQDSRTGKAHSIQEWLSTKANLAKPTKKLIEELALQTKDAQLRALLQPELEEKLETFLAHWNVPELLATYKAIFLPSELPLLLSPMLPRFYSIASSMRHLPEIVHLTVSHVRYEIAGKRRVGVCSHFLCGMEHEGPVPLPVPVYVQQTRDFLLPEDNRQPIIMIGPGTGVAPFRAFMQERIYRGDFTEKNWLFFGERHSAYDFFYEEYWQELVAKGHLHLDVAFSRDKEEKEYVQHKMWQQREKLWSWLQEGAKIYVCGDASSMAKDVDACLQRIVKSLGALTDEQTRAYMTALRKEKRYLRDVY